MAALKNFVGAAEQWEVWSGSGFDGSAWSAYTESEIIFRAYYLS
jgi:hypothetical protein